MKLSARLLAFFSVVAMLSIVLILPARAVLVDYNDYVTNVQVDGDNDIVTVRIPADLAFVRVFNAATNKEIYRGYGLSHSIPFEKDVSYQVRINIFGYPYSTDYGLDLSYIPVGTEITSGFGFLFNGDWGVMSSPYPVVNYCYYDSSSNVELDIDTKVLTDLQSQWDSFTDTYVVQSVPNASRLGIFYHLTPCEWFSDSPTDLAPVGITVNDTVMTFSISSLLRQQQLTGKTNDLLKEVESQLAAQGKTLDDIKASQDETNEKLDDIINGEVSGETPSGGDVVGDLESAEDQLMDSVGGGSDEFDDTILSAWDTLYSYSQSFLAFGVLFELFADIPFFHALASIALALGTFAFLINLSSSAGRAWSRSTAKGRVK